MSLGVEPMSGGKVGTATRRECLDNAGPVRRSAVPRTEKLEQNVGLCGRLIIHQGCDCSINFSGLDGRAGLISRNITGEELIGDTLARRRRLDAGRRHARASNIVCPCRTRFYGESSRVRTVQSRQSMRLRNFARAFLHGFVPFRASGCKTLASRLEPGG